MPEPIASAYVELRGDLSKIDDDIRGGLTTALDGATGKAATAGDDIAASLESASARAQTSWERLGLGTEWADLTEHARNAGIDVEGAMQKAADLSQGHLKGISDGDPFSDMTADAKTAGDKVGKSMKDAETDGKKALGGIDNKGSDVFKHLRDLALTVGLGAILNSSVKAADESAANYRELQAVITSTGSAAGLTADQVAEIAKRTSIKIGVDDDDIIKAQSVLLTFKNIGGSSLEEVTGLAADMSSVFGGDLSGSAVQLGKALNDPVQGVSALTRVGVTFTDQQKEQIKALVESGDTLGAQAIIMKEVKSQVGGAAEAAATGTDKIGVALGNLKESLGAGLSEALTNLAPSLTTALDEIGPTLGTLGASLGSILSEVVPALVPIAEELLPALADAFSSTTSSLLPLLPILSDGLLFTLKALKPILPEIVVGLIALKVANSVGDSLKAATGAAKLFGAEGAIQAAATKAWTAAQWLFNAAMDANPITLVVIAIAALAAGIVYAYFHFQSVRDIIDATWQIMQQVADFVVNVFTGIWDGVSTAVSFVTGIFTDFHGTVSSVYDFVVGFFTSLPETILGFAVEAVKIFVELPIKIEIALATLAVTILTSLAQTFADALVAAGKWVLDFLIWYETLPFKVGMALLDLAPTVVGKIGDMAGQAATATLGFVTDTVDTIGGLPGKAVDALLDLGGDIAGAIGDAAVDVLSAAEGLVDDAVDAIAKLPGKAIDALAGIGGQIFDTVKSAFKNVWNDIIDSLPAFHSDPLGRFGPDINVSFGFLKLADGAILRQPTFFQGGEAGAEAVIPMTRPGRAMQLMSESGLGSMWEQNRGGSGPLIWQDKVTYADATDADLVAQRVNAALMARALTT